MEILIFAFQNSFHFVNVKLDAERFPPYLPERRAYTKLTLFVEEKKKLILIGEAISFFEVKSKAAKRFKVI